MSTWKVVKKVITQGPRGPAGLDYDVALRPPLRGGPGSGSGMARAGQPRLPRRPRPLLRSPSCGTIVIRLYPSSRSSRGRRGGLWGEGVRPIRRCRPACLPSAFAQCLPDALHTSSQFSLEPGKAGVTLPFC